jgi:taurine---2-oxoglutarate transaminase
MFASKTLFYHTLKPWFNTKTRHFLDLGIKSASGCHYILENNKKVIDFTSGLMVTNLGHNNKYVNKKMKNFIDNGLLYAPPAILIEEREKLSNRLLDISPIKKGKVFYTNGGADANESAVYFAKSYSTKSYSAKSYSNNLQNITKDRILRFENSFHGGSSYISSYLGGDNRRKEKLSHFDLSLTLDSSLPNPKMSDGGEESLNVIKQIFEKEHKSISGILIEGSSGTGGIYTYPEGYLNSVMNLAKKYEILVIADEVMSGFGRTGKMFGLDHCDYEPDMITMAKGITNGSVPMGGVILSEKLSQQFDNNIVNNGLTYSGHPLACVAANACLDEYLKNDMEVIRNCDNLGQILLRRLREIKFKYPNLIVDVRGIGLLCCIEFKEGLVNDFVKELVEKNIYTFSKGNNLFISPPLIIDEKLLLQTMDKIEDILFENYI